MAGSVAPTTWFQHKDDCIPKLKECGVEFVVNHKLDSIDEKGITVIPVRTDKNNKFVDDGEPERIDCDAVILSLGSRPVNGLAKELEGKYERLYVIGDAGKIGRIADATAAGYRVAANLE